MTKHWQNLIHKKCPDCGSIMQESKIGFTCKVKLEGGSCTFFINKTKMAEILTDKNHATVRFMNEHEKELLNEALQELGVVADKFWEDKREKPDILNSTTVSSSVVDITGSGSIQL